ncbi:hypothetical protein TorRG33x02_082600 [Trema orientale]|uniref:Uncharacterized protein n=1 Tax=Trema orientale TaxID=63057 RepID=A0A2P5FE12_TREOI|nr:hypothetical protein TorRG33x02_082600 [Trema orientale]
MFFLSCILFLILRLWASSPKEILTLEEVSTMFLFHFRAI